MSFISGYGGGGRRGSRGGGGGGTNFYANLVKGFPSGLGNSLLSGAGGYFNGVEAGLYPKFSGENDPYYQSVLSGVNASRAADMANRQSNVRQALIAYGLVPQGYNDQYGDINSETRDAINKNTSSGISTYARILEGRKEGNDALVNRLAARGLFRSGAKGHGLKKNQLDFDRNVADTLAQLMGNISGFNNSYAQNEMARQQQLASALAQAYQNYVPPTGSYNFISPTSSGGGGSNNVVKTATAPAYVGTAAGNYWNQNR